METKKENNINLTPEAIEAIESLQARRGTLPLYAAILERMSTMVLHHAGDIGMSDGEALNTLRALDLLRCDVIAISGRTGMMCAESTDELQERLEYQLAAEDTAEADEDYED